nr:GntR family transcriptional regulator [uncultured Sphaerochaeta sp.]
MNKDNKSSKIYNELKNEIMRGDYPAAYSLTETELAKRFDVCRNTIKKSLLMLEADRFVTMERNKGAKIKNFSVDEVLEFLEVREELESFIIRNTIRNITEEQIEELSMLLEKMAKLKEEKNLIEYSNCNKQFHNMIYEACSNKTAVNLTLNLKDQMKKYNGKTIFAPGRDESSLAEHTKILEAIKRKDEKTAELYMRIHIRNVASTFKSYYSLLF